MAPDADAYTVDWSEHATRLVAQAEDEQQWYERLTATLVRPDDRLAADIGCGGGGMTLALAAALGEPGRVLAVDGTPGVLAAVAERLADRPGPLARVDLVEADLDAGVDP
ncbi:MAG: methyltransferase domain-containing protein, partial [Natronosporangium sp.]